VMRAYPAKVQQIGMKYRVSLPIAAMLFLQLMQGQSAPAMAEGGKVEHVFFWPHLPPVRSTHESKPPVPNLESQLGISHVGDRRYIPQEPPQPQPEPEVTGRAPSMRTLTPAENEAWGRELALVPMQEQIDLPGMVRSGVLRLNPYAWDSWLEGLRESENVEDPQGLRHEPLLPRVPTKSD
jgi:hypothetical protein